MTKNEITAEDIKFEARKINDEVGAFIEEIARADAAHAFSDFLLKRGFELSRNKHAGAVGADLAGAEEVGHHGDVRREIQIRIVENNQR